MVSRKTLEHRSRFVARHTPPLTEPESLIGPRKTLLAADARAVAVVERWILRLVGVVAGPATNASKVFFSHWLVSRASLAHRASAPTRTADVPPFRWKSMLFSASCHGTGRALFACTVRLESDAGSALV